MEVFTWFSVIAFVFYGVREIDNKYGDSCIGGILIFLAVAIVAIEITT